MESEEREPEKESHEDPTTSQGGEVSGKVNDSGEVTKSEQTSSPSNEPESEMSESSMPEKEEKKSPLTQTSAETEMETAPEDIPEKKKLRWEECPLDPEKDADFFAKPWFQKFVDERSNVVLKYFILKLTLPFVCASMVILFLYAYTVTFYSWDVFETLGSAMVVYFLPPLGVEVAVPVAIYLGVPAYLIVIAITLIDANVGIFLVWNFDIAKKVPGVGRFIRKLERTGGEVLEKRKWVERLSIIGIALFVMIPFQGSGAVGGALIGRAIGMNPYKVLLGVIIGSFLGALIVAIFTDQFMDWFNVDPEKGF